MKTKIDHFLNSLDRSPRTIFAYRNALEQYIKAVGEDAELNTDTYIKFLVTLKDKSSATQRLYTTAVLKFYLFCKAGNWAELKDATSHYTKKSAQRAVYFNREAVEKMISYCESLHEGLLDLRDRAFLLTLVDTGLRISEACSLKRGDIDWQHQLAFMIASGNKRTIARCSKRSIQALNEYLYTRESVGLKALTPISSEPVFARHDIRASKRVRPIAVGGMWKALKDRMTEAGVDRRSLRIHDFRHYFVTKTYLAKRDLKLSQELARHESIATTMRYTHLGSEADADYDDIFNKK